MQPVLAGANLPAMNRREWALLLILATLWGGSFFFLKILASELPTLTIVWARLAVSALVLNLWIYSRGDRMPSTMEFWAPIGVMSLFNNLIPFILITFAESRITSGLASILNASTPLFTVLFAHWFTSDERATAAKAIGVVGGFLGVALLIGETFGGDIVGESASLVAAISYAGSGLFARRFRTVQPIKLATGQVTIGALMLLPFAALIDRPWTMASPSPEAWSAILGLSLLSTVIAYEIFFRLLASAGATNVLLVTFLSPIAAVILGAAFLGESIVARQFAALALIAGGILLIDGRLLKAKDGSLGEREIGR